jgi:hypothetical protein
MAQAFCKGGALQGGILFRDPDYTNINWTGFWITNVLLTMICIASYTIRWIEKAGNTVRKIYCNFKNYLREKVSLAGKAFKAPHLLRAKGTAGICAWFSRSWRQPLSPTFLGQGSNVVVSGSHVSELQQMGHEAGERNFDVDNPV